LTTQADLGNFVARGGEAVLDLVGDMHGVTDTQLAVGTATRHFGRLNAVIACPGVVAEVAPLKEIIDATWDAV
jgi:NAD(P)-dependent dehydrogenase (short-subunit alcohol dehydrogenase family)